MYSQIISKATKLREKSITAKKHALCTECCAAGYDRCPAAYPAPVPHFHSDAPECSLLPWFHRIPVVTEAAHRCSQCKRPNVQTNRRTVVLRQVNARRFNGHRPTMYPLTSVPPEVQCFRRMLWKAEFIEFIICSHCFFYHLLILRRLLGRFPNFKAIL